METRLKILLAKRAREVYKRSRISYQCAVSSAVEHMLHTHGVTGSNPVSRTIFRL